VCHEHLTMTRWISRCDTHRLEGAWWRRSQADRPAHVARGAVGPWVYLVPNVRLDRRSRILHAGDPSSRWVRVPWPRTAGPPIGPIITSTAHIVSTEPGLWFGALDPPNERFLAIPCRAAFDEIAD